MGIVMRTLFSSFRIERTYASRHGYLDKHIDDHTLKSTGKQWQTQSQSLRFTDRKPASDMLTSRNDECCFSRRATGGTFFGQMA